MLIDAINTNLTALDASKNLLIEEENKRRTLEQLAASDRIKRTQDEATTLKISQDHIAQQHVAEAEAARASVVASTLAGAAGVARVNAAVNLTHLNQLQTLAASSTLTEIERGKVQAEIEALKSQIDRAAKAAEADRESEAIAATSQAATGLATTTASIQSTDAAAVAAADSSHIIADKADASVHAQANQDHEVALRLLNEEG